MKEKKNISRSNMYCGERVSIGATVSPETKEKLIKIAKDKEWTLSMVVNYIIKTYLNSRGQK